MPDDLERFTNSVARQLRGDPAPERDNIAERTDDAYLAALQRERQADLDEGDEDAELEDQHPSSLDDELRAIAEGAVSRWTAAPDDEADTEDADPGPEPDWQPALDTWAANLTAAERERIDAGGPEAAQASFMEFVEQQAARERFERLRSGESAVDEGAASDAPMPQTGAQFVDWAVSNAAQIRAEFDMSVPEYLARMASANHAEWRQIARESGVGPDAKPGYMQLGRAGQAQLLTDDLNREMERLRERGGFIE